MLIPRPGQAASDLANRAKAALQQRLGRDNPVASQAAMAQARATLDRINRSRVADTPVGKALSTYIQRQLAVGAGLEPLVDQLVQKAKAELARRQHLVAGLQDILRMHFTGAGKLFRLRSEVLQPARARMLSKTEAWQRIDDIAYGRPATRSDSSATPGDRIAANAAGKTVFPVLDAFERRFGNLYFSVEAKAEASVVLGGGASLGIGGMRHGKGFFAAGYTVGLGLSADVQGAVEIGVSMQAPETATKLTFEVAAGAGYGVAGEVTVALVPSIGLGQQKPAPPPKFIESPGNYNLKAQFDYLKDTKYDGLIFDYAFDGISVNIGVGVGADFSTSIALEDSVLLRP